MVGPVLMPSTRKGKRFMVLVDGKAVHFGSAGGKAFIDHGSTEKKIGLDRATWRASRWSELGRPVYGGLLG